MIIVNYQQRISGRGTSSLPTWLSLLELVLIRNKIEEEEPAEIHNNFFVPTKKKTPLIEEGELPEILREPRSCTQTVKS